MLKCSDSRTARTRDEPMDVRWGVVVRAKRARFGRKSGLVAVGFSVAVAFATLVQADAISGGAPGDTAIQSPDKAAVEARLAARNAELEKIASSPELSAAVVARKKADQARANATAAAPGIVTPPPEGIFEDPEAPASGSVFLGTNRWVGQVAGKTVAVYAGRAGEDESVGRLLIMVAGPSMQTESGGHADLAGTGALRVASADGTTLTITDARGKTHTFDVVTRRLS